MFKFDDNSLIKSDSLSPKKIEENESQENSDSEEYDETDLIDENATYTG